MKKHSKKPHSKRKHPKSAAPSRAHRAAKPSFELEALEPRILLSGTWVGTEGNDSFSDGNGDSNLSGLGGDDVIHGGNQNDTISGGAGNDQLFGDNHDDYLDGGTGDDQIYGGSGNDILNSGGGNDLMDGGSGTDVFRFDGAQHGDVITVVGGPGSDTIDLSPYAANNVSNNGSAITVNLGSGQSFTINHSGVENVVTGAPANTAPSADGGSLTINEDSAASTVTLSGTDPDAGDAVTQYRIESLPSNGTLRLNGNAVSANDIVTQTQIDAGQLTFQPDGDWNGSTSFTYKAHDGDAWSADAGTFNITVNAVNDAPVTGGGNLSMNEDGVATAVTLNGTDPDAGDAVTQYRIESLPANGTLRLDGNAVNANDLVTQAQIDGGQLTFQPNADWNGSTSFNYRAHDGDVFANNFGTFNINVNAVNDAPTTGGGNLTLSEDGSGAVSLSGTDPDAGDAVSSYRIETLPANGQLRLNGVAVNANDTITQAQIDGGQLTFHPNSDWNGSTSFNYKAHDGDAFSANTGTFSINVNAVNDAPVASAGSITVSENASATLALSGTDPDAGDAVEQYRIESLPANGALMLNGVAVNANDVVTQAQISGGQLTFQPNAGWSGSTSLSFRASDGEAWSANAATFDINVSSVNDAPITGGGNLTLNEDAAATAVTISGTDPDAGDAVTQYRIESLPTNGTLRLNGNAVNTNDLVTQAQIDGGQLTFQANADWNGSTGFNYRSHDGDVFADNVGTFNITVNALNDAPTAGGGNLTLSEDGSGAVSLSGTDPDAGDAVSSYRIETLPANGQLRLNGVAVNANDTITQAQIDGGQLTFHPNSDWSGATSFTYKAHDGDAFSANAGTFNITVNAVNDAPTAAGGSLTVNEDAAATAVTLSGTDPDAGDAVTQYRIESLPANGTLRLDGNVVNANDVVTQAQIDGGQLTFQPNPDWNGSTSFTYKTHDGDAFSADTGTFNITVNAVNDAPTTDAGADQSVDELTQVTLTASASSDLDGQGLTHAWTQVGGPAVNLSDANVAQPTFVAPDVATPTTLTFQVAVSDGQATTMDTVAVTVNPVAVQTPPPAVYDPPPVPQPVVTVPPGLISGTQAGATPVIVPDAAPTVDVDDQPVVDGQLDPTPAPVSPPTPVDPGPIATPTDPTTPVNEAPSAPPTSDAPSTPTPGPAPHQPTILFQPGSRDPLTALTPQQAYQLMSDADRDVITLGTAPNSAGQGVVPAPVTGFVPPEASGGPNLVAESPVNAGGNQPESPVDTVGVTPTPTAGTDRNPSGLQWNENESIGMLDPMEHLSGAVELVRREADAPPEAVSTDLPAGLEHEFRVTEVYTLPTLASMGTLAAGLVPPAPGRLTARDAYQDGSGQADGDNARRWRSRFTDESLFDDLSGIAAADGDGRRHAADDVAASETEASGFFARVWGAVRGIGATTSRFGERSGDDERDDKRG